MAGVQLAAQRSRSRIYIAGAGILTIIVVLIAIASSHGEPAKLITSATHSLQSDLLDDVRNATLGFQKIFVINLPSRTDHRDAMSLAASLSGLQFEYIEGVTEVSPKALPPGDSAKKLSEGELGNWRAHMNIAQRMVEQNIASALILEDDVDWDIRIKDQMQDFARASRLLVQPIPGSDNDFLDPSYPTPSPDEQPKNIYVGRSSRTTKPTTSPYGDLDRWDLFWLGHCGTYFPTAERTPNRPIGRAVLLDDMTVPAKQHFSIQYGNDELTTEYPAHTRVVTRGNRNICTLGYAISLPGARRLLYQLGLTRLDEPPDVSFRSFCDGGDRPLATCLTVQPELIQHHRPVGNKASFSDVGFRFDEINEQAYTRNIRWSTRLNMLKLMEGHTDYIDLFQDDGKPNDWEWGKR